MKINELFKNINFFHNLISLVNFNKKNKNSIFLKYIK
uniref:Uncharacterized protein n=1 Tax=viral metagenome TaxID=1070528 RepID=A0A6C0AD65_9ZZZZ